jgi:lysophospholipase L1-like esterase
MHQVTEALSQPARLSMVVLGDSLAFGYGASQEEYGLAQRIFAQIRAAKPASTYANHAVPHSTMGDVLRHQIPKLHGTQADLVLLIAGANDLRYTLDRFVFARRFRALLDAVHKYAPQASVIVGGMPDVTQTIGVPQLLKPAIVRLCSRLNETMRSIAAEYGDCFLDMFAFTNAPLCAGAVYLCEDGYHPNDFGYAEISERAYAVISQKLGTALPLDEAPSA